MERACLEHRHKTDLAFIGTAGLWTCCVLLIYAYSFSVLKHKEKLPSQTLPGLSLHINPRAMQVFNFSICKCNWKLARLLCGNKKNSGSDWTPKIDSACVRQGGEKDLKVFSV
jgi:hypothetical protein